MESAADFSFCFDYLCGFCCQGKALTALHLSVSWIACWLWSAAHPDLAKFASFGKGTYSVIQEIANATGLLTSIGCQPSTMSIDENTLESNIKTYPNPFTNQLNFAVGNLKIESNTEVKVMDVLGKTISQYSYANKTELNETIDLSNVSNGVYFLKVTNNNKQSVYRIIKN